MKEVVLVRERVRWRPLIGSGGEEEKGIASCDWVS